MKILKSGTVTITNEGISITHFTYDCEGAGIGLLNLQRDALKWAQDRIRDTLETALDTTKEIQK